MVLACELTLSLGQQAEVRHDLKHPIRIAS